MFGMSMTEIVIILVVALLILGPKELPKAAKTIGKTLRDVRRASDDLRNTFEREIMADDDLPKRPVRPPEGSIAAGSLPEPSTTDTSPPAPADEPAPPHVAPAPAQKTGESA